MKKKLSYRRNSHCDLPAAGGKQQFDAVPTQWLRQWDNIHGSSGVLAACLCALQGKTTFALGEC